jgi:dTDP-4-dehydrorhamnose 3,5-epimerase
VKPLVVHSDERGRLFEVLRSDEAIFSRFGQAYVSCTWPGAVKGWHWHERQDDYFTCLSGMLKLVVWDDRPDSPTRGVLDEIFIGDHNLALVVVPRQTWHGWKCVSDREAMVLNLVTETFDRDNPDEKRLPPHGNGVIPYDWARRDG